RREPQRGGWGNSLVLEGNRLAALFCQAGMAQPEVDVHPGRTELACQPVSYRLRIRAVQPGHRIVADEMDDFLAAHVEDAQQHWDGVKEAAQERPSLREKEIKSPRGF